MQPNHTTTRLFRSRTDTMLGGVCGGLAQYLNVDVVLVRMFFVLLAFAAGTGLLIYLAMWIIVPAEGQQSAALSGQPQYSPWQSNSRQGSTQGAMVIGTILLVIGVLFLIENVAGFWFPWLGLSTMWPLLLVLAGVALLWGRVRGN